MNRIKNFIRFWYHQYKAGTKSYSQTGEDIIASFYLPKKQGFYVDVGTNDPKYLNNTYYFYKRGWRGVCIEPDRRKVSVLRAFRHRDQVLSMGVGEAVNEMPFYCFDPDTLSTFDAETSESYQKLGHVLRHVEKVKVKPLSEIFTSDVQVPESGIDLLSVDTEGYDMQVLKSNDWSRFRPKLVLVEMAIYEREKMTRVSKDFIAFFEKHNYWLLADTHINGIFIEAGYAERQKLSP